MPEIEQVDISIQGSVVSFSESYEKPVGAKLLTYWKQLRGSAERPRWADFDFLDVFEITPYLIIKDVIDGGTEFRNRYWGTNHTQLEQFDATGQLTRDYYKPEHMTELLELYNLPLHNPTPLIMHGRQFYHEENEWRPYAAVCVGFTDDDGNVDKLVCAYDE